MSALASLLIYLAVIAALWIAYRIRKHRHERSRPRLGDADAYDGNLIIPSAAGRPSTPIVHKSHGGHMPHGGAHAGHGGGHADHGVIGGHHH